MSVKAVILGFLKEGPLHGYELKRMIERVMGDWADIAFGSIYFALEGLTRDGFATSRSEEGRGRRPSRIVYTITEAGKEEYPRLLRELWRAEGPKSHPVDIAVAFMRDLPSSEIAGYLDERVACLEETLSYLDAHERETMANGHVPPESRFIFSHSRHHMEAELAWARELRGSIEQA